MNGRTQKKRPMRNQDIRVAIEEAGLYYWWVAEELGIASGCARNFSRRNGRRFWPPSGGWRSGRGIPPRSPPVPA